MQVRLSESTDSLNLSHRVSSRDKLKRIREDPPHNYLIYNSLSEVTPIWIRCIVKSAKPSLWLSDLPYCSFSSRTVVVWYSTEWVDKLFLAINCDEITAYLWLYNSHIIMQMCTSNSTKGDFLFVKGIKIVKISRNRRQTPKRIVSLEELLGEFERVVVGRSENSKCKKGLTQGEEMYSYKVCRVERNYCNRRCKLAPR